MQIERPRINGAGDTDERRQIRLEVERFIRENYRFHLFAAEVPMHLHVAQGPMVKTSPLAPFPVATMQIVGQFYQRPRGMTHCARCAARNPWRPVGWSLHFRYDDWNPLETSALRRAMRVNRLNVIQHVRGQCHTLAGWDGLRVEGGLGLERIVKP